MGHYMPLLIMEDYTGSADRNFFNSLMSPTFDKINKSLLYWGLLLINEVYLTRVRRLSTTH
jgi:hypothetical protein